MRFPWANTLLLVLILAELVTGYFGLTSGSSEKAIYIQAHRVAGYGILAILLWKSRNILFSLRWRRARTPRTASMALLVLLLATLALGLAWSLAGPFSFWLFSGVSWHIYVGAALLPILIWHSLYHTRGFPIRFWADRRSFLRLAGLVAIGFAGWQVAELGVRATSLSGEGRRFTGSYGVTGRPPGSFPVVSWLNDRPQPVESSRWRLAIGGQVQRELVLGYEELAADAKLDATIDCTGGWYSTQTWRGVPVARLLRMASPGPQARSVTFTSVTGYYRRFSVEEAERYLLATHVGGRPLSHGHGFPVRLVAPGKRGFEWVKWVVEIEVNDTPKWLQPPIPLQ